MKVNGIMNRQLVSAVLATVVGCCTASLQGQQPGPSGQPASAPAGPAPATVPNPGLHRLPPARPTGEAELTPAERRDRAASLVNQGRAAYQAGDLAAAADLARRAEALRVPDNEFPPSQQRPWQLLLDIDRAARNPGLSPGGPQAFALPPGGIMQAGGVLPPGMSDGQPAQQGIYNPAADPTANIQARSLQTDPVPASPGEELFRRGMEALSAGDSVAARELFRQAWQFEADLDPATRRQLKDKLALMQTPPSRAQSAPMPPVSDTQRTLREELFREITLERAEITKLKERDPLIALKRMQELRRRIDAAAIDPASRNQLQRIVATDIESMEEYVDRNRANIEQDLRNRDILKAIEEEERKYREIDQKVAELVDQFNGLMDERRYAEAWVVAKQVQELKPNSEIASTMYQTARTNVRVQEMEDIAADKEQGFVDQLAAVEQSSVPFDDSRPYRFAENWEELSRNRQRLQERQESPFMGPKEQDIKRRLSTQVDVRFQDRSLAEVLNQLSTLSGVPIFLDERALADVRLTRDEPVTLDLNQQISLKSALQLILQPLDLIYVIRNEVLEVTTRDRERSVVYPEVYNVADLVTPIPNFVGGNNFGLAAALRDAYEMTNSRLSVATTPVSLVGLANNQTGNPPPYVHAQLGGGMPNLGGSFGGGPVGDPFGVSGRPVSPVGGLGGGAIADFDSLMMLIQSTVEPDAWDSVGGNSTMQPYAGNLSLVISTTSEIHDQIADLLESLRRLQNLQVTIEVRFISLADNFLEQIGVDFDFDLDDNVNDIPEDDSGNSVTIGIGQNNLPTADFDISFNQDFIGAAVPAFGGNATPATFGFAILSDIEAFFFLQAAQADNRTNVLQAPKVTLFDGQIASINDTSARPFVISVTPVVGDFAVAQQPVIIVLNEGTQMNVQAVVSDDRRFVRMTLVPFFSRIDEVNTFTFEGGSTRSSSTTDQEDNDGDGEIDEEDEASETERVGGTTVQLPTFASTSVSTTVSVPDGGTILLGGIKRLRESRSEQGVPMLSKLPFINRLFRNVGIGRDTNSLMLMVTPRIIIPEEEEEAQTGYISR